MCLGSEMRLAFWHNVNNSKKLLHQTFCVMNQETLNIGRIGPGETVQVNLPAPELKGILHERSKTESQVVKNLCHGRLLQVISGAQWLACLASLFGELKTKERPCLINNNNQTKKDGSWEKAPEAVLWTTYVPSNTCKDMQNNLDFPFASLIPYLKTLIENNNPLTNLSVR